jgi:enoyl-[acyl-carrier protein] reductase I
MTVSLSGHDSAAGISAATMPAGAALRLLEGKRLVVTGVATRSSIAFAVARVAQLLGAEVVLTSFGRMHRLTERAARRLPEPADVYALDVNCGEDFERLTEDLDSRWGRVDGALHAVAFAPPDAMGGFVATPPESAELAFRTSAYSLNALAAALVPLMHNGGSIVALGFDAARAWPSYDWMGVSKAALEAIGRYLARDLGQRGVRVNVVSCGPYRTIAATGVPSFDDLVATWQVQAPLGWDPDETDVVAGPVCFLLSDLASGITGEVLHVDGGFNAVAVPGRAI